MNHKSSPTIATNLKNEELLELYLCLPKKRREERFTDTAHAAEMTGLSVRTIQSWIESGVVRAIHIGKKYQVDLNSLKEFLRGQTDR
jgi:excisionase family DNA binding protein